MPPLNDDFAALAPRFTGGISAVSSCTIIYIIIKSGTKLSTIYNRLMFGISTATLFSSIAISLTTLPMPRDLPISDIGYDWAGTRLGNVHTCNAQGFFLITGYSMMFTYTGMLCIYYMLVIAFGLREKKIAKYAEPFFHLITLGTSYMAFNAVFTGKINPTGWEPCCTIANDSFGPHTYENGRRTYVVSVLGTFLLCTFLCFILIIRKVAKDERNIRRSVQIQNPQQSPNPFPTATSQRQVDLQNMVLTASKNTRLVVFQALAYYISFLITLSTPIIRLITGYDHKSENDERIILRAQIVLMPLHGLSIAVIFIYHKIHNYRRIHPNVSKWQAFNLLFYGMADDNILFSRISVVSVTADELTVEVQNERSEVEHINIFISNNDNDNRGTEEEEEDDDDVERNTEDLPSSKERQHMSLDDGSSKGRSDDLSGFSAISLRYNSESSSSYDMG